MLLSEESCKAAKGKAVKLCETEAALWQGAAHHWRKVPRDVEEILKTQLEMVLDSLPWLTLPKQGGQLISEGPTALPILWLCGPTITSTLLVCSLQTYHHQSISASKQFLLIHSSENWAGCEGNKASVALPKTELSIVAPGTQDNLEEARKPPKSKACRSQWGVVFSPAAPSKDRWVCQEWARPRVMRTLLSTTAATTLLRREAPVAELLPRVAVLQTDTRSTSTLRCFHKHTSGSG